MSPHSTTDTVKRFESPWEEVRLGDVAEVRGGGTPSTSNQKFWNGNIDWYTPSEISTNSARFIAGSQKKITKDGLINSSAHLIPEHSLLVTSRASIGNCAVTNKMATTNQGITSLIPTKKTQVLFLYYWTIFHKTLLSELSNGSTFLEISPKTISNIRLSLPPFSEQKAIAQALTDIDAEIEVLEAKLKKSREVKTGMMQQLLTGRIRLPMEGY